jgi:hypothetical protein
VDPVPDTLLLRIFGAPGIEPEISRSVTRNSDPKLCQTLHSLEGELSLCLCNEALRREDLWKGGYIDSRFLQVRALWRLIVKFTSRRKIS